MGKLSGQRALITGGSSGIGLATGRLFALEGAAIVLAARNKQNLDEARQWILDSTDTSSIVDVFPADVSKLEDISSLMQKIKASGKKLDVLVVNSGICQVAPLGQITEKHYDDLMNINFKSALFTVQYAYTEGLLNDGARIVFVTSIVNKRGYPANSVYAASKAALLSLMQCLALELIPQGIRVNAVCPGPVATPILNGLGFSDEQLDALKTQIAQRCPSRRMGNPDEIASTILYLASDDSKYTVGAEIVVDGGMSISET